MGGKSKSQTVGYKYYMGLHMAMCYGPIDAMLEIRGGDRTAWKGIVTASGQISINSPNLYGGDEKEGGLVGTLDVMMGEPTQAPNSYLAAKIGANRPAYRGLFGVVYRGGQIASNNPYVKPWSFQLRRIKKGWASDSCWYPTTAEIQIYTFLVGGYYNFDEIVTTSPGSSTLRSVANTDGISYTPTGQVYWFQRPNESGIGHIKGGEPDNAAVIQMIDKGWTLDKTATLAFNSGVTTAAVISLSSTPPSTPAGVWTMQDGSPYSTTLGTVYLFTSEIVVSDPPTSAGYSMNPAHIVYQCLTDPEWGMGYDASIIDDSSFRAAADTFYGESLGLCLQWARQDSIENFIQLVLDHAGACLVEDRRTLLWKLIPIRGGYDPESLPHFSDTPGAGEFRILELTRFERSALTDATNELTVSYTDVVTGKNGSVTVQNLAAVQAAGRVISQSRDYPGLPTSTLAVRTAMRDLRAATSGLAKVQLVLDRNGYDLLPGNVIRWSWSPDGIVGMVLRIVSIDYGSLTDGRVRVECVEDVFGLPASTYADVPPIGWEEPDTTAQPSPAVAAFEAPFRELIQAIGRSETLALPADSGYVGAVAARAPGVNVNFQLYTSAGGEPYQDTGVADWTPTGTLTADIGQTTTAITLASAQDLDLVDVGTTGMLGSDPYSAEVVRVDGIDPDAGTLTIARGCLDTTPKAWPAGTRFWSYDEYTAASATEYTDGESLSCKVLTRTSTDLLAEGLAPSASVTMGARAARPYPPGKLRVTDTVASNVAYPSECFGALTLSWVHRDRLLQDDKVIDTEQASIGPEPGTTYTVRFYLNNVLDSTQTGISGASSASYTLTGNGEARVEVWAVRDGLESWQAAAASFQYYVTPYSTRIVDGGDTRSTDAGDTRITE